MGERNSIVSIVHHGDNIIAAYKAGYDYWGAELDADYFRTGCERFESFRTETEEIKQYGYARTELEKENPLLFAE